jgi:hypothetical protein
MPDLQSFAHTGSLLQIVSIYSSKSLTQDHEWTVDPDFVGMAAVPKGESLDDTARRLARSGLRPLEVHEIQAMILAGKRPKGINHAVRIDVPMDVRANVGDMKAWVTYNPFCRETPLQVDMVQSEGSAMALAARTIATYPIMEGDRFYEHYDASDHPFEEVASVEPRRVAA